MDQTIGRMAAGHRLDGQALRHAEAPPRKTRSYTSLAAHAVSDVPIYIPTFNNPSYAANMLRQLGEWNIGNVFIIDNCSTSPEMIGFLDDLPRGVKVIRLPENRGPQHVVISDLNYGFLPEIFCVTDPDLEFNEAMPQDFLYELLMLTHKHGVGKAGLALSLLDRHLMKEEKFQFGGNHYHVWEWESQFWTQPLGHIADGSAVFKANVDTTFALYNKAFFRRETFYDAVRLSGRYTCRHLPWYKDTGIPTKEESFYKATQKHSYHMR